MSKQYMNIKKTLDSNLGTIQREGVHPPGDCPHQVWEDHRLCQGQTDFELSP